MVQILLPGGWEENLSRCQGCSQAIPWRMSCRCYMLIYQLFLAIHVCISSGV